MSGSGKFTVKSSLGRLKSAMFAMLNIAEQDDSPEAKKRANEIKEKLASLPGKGKWARVHHPTPCRCPQPSSPIHCHHRQVVFCKRHRVYVCEGCGTRDRLASAA